MKNFSNRFDWFFHGAVLQEKRLYLLFKKLHLKDFASVSQQRKGFAADEGRIGKETPFASATARCVERKSAGTTAGQRQQNHSSSCSIISSGGTSSHNSSNVQEAEQ